jgi:adenylosuccinate lyase
LEVIHEGEGDHISFPPSTILNSIFDKGKKMNSTPITYEMYGEKFATREMLEVFEEKHFIQMMLNVERELSRAEGMLGLIPKEAADEIVAKASVEHIDFETVKNHLEISGHYIVSLTKGLQNACKHEYGQYVHFGATTQDIIDTSQVLGLKEASGLIERDLRSVRKNLIGMALKYKDTPMAGRTHADHAVPLTFGFKAGVWLDEVDRHLDRFQEMKKRLFVGNITGAVGTFASFGGEKGMQVQRRALEALGLNTPRICWHAARDRFAEFTGNLASLAATAAKIANEIKILMRPEIGEIEEPIAEGRVGSSTMPHKRNPKVCEDTIAISKIIRSLHGTMLEAMGVEHERDGSYWRSEFIVLPEICLLTSALLRNTVFLTANLVVHPVRMRKNLDITKGLIVSEGVMFKIAEKMGKQEAHELVYRCSMRAHAKGMLLLDALMEDERIQKRFSREELMEALDPAAYTGLSSLIVEKLTRDIVEGMQDVHVDG